MKVECDSMGMFVNPDNSAFQVALNTKIYVDKTGFIEYTNSVLDTKQALICNSRPRRFGKSTTADMLVAYYSRGCNSEKMFEGMQISTKDSFKEHLNRYDVIRLDVQWFLSPSKSVDTIVQRMESSIISELREYYVEELKGINSSLAEALAVVRKRTGRKFIIIIDEWDVLIRTQPEGITTQQEYIDFLRTLFKGSHSTEFLHLAYLTGILPIKKLKTESALNNFDEFTMLDAKVLAPYMGFTQEEVQKLCKLYARNFNEVKRWYDGYLLENCHIYNPKAVVNVMLWGGFRSYWTQTGTYEAILPLINMDFDGLKTAIIQMISGASVEVNVESFQNDMVTFEDKDDVITLLIHLGYLAYDNVRKVAFIPNEEIRQEFMVATKKKKWNELLNFQKKSAELLDATLDMDGEMAAEEIEKIHSEFASTIQYNDENSLSSVLTIAYLGAMQYYFMPIRELPTGRGFADYVFIPKPEYMGEFPALLIELKWNKQAKTALQQIKDKKYVQSILNYTGDILLVGINYDKKRKKHDCVIEKYVKDFT